MTRSVDPRIEIASGTHPGLSRPINEDRFRVIRWHLPEPEGTAATLAVVSDGIGGNVAGEVAAQIVVDQVCQSLEHSPGVRPLDDLRHSVVAAGRAVAARGQVEPGLAGMGATVALAWVLGQRLYISCVGDSRIYLLRARRLRQLSTDHTFVQEAVERGTLAAAEARNHPYGHVLKQHLGGSADPEPDLRLRLGPRDNDAQAKRNQGLRLRAGDTILLCTDGLSDLVPAAEIGALVGAPDLEAGLAHLIQAALARGGTDNVTALALRVADLGGPPRGLRRWLARRG